MSLWSWIGLAALVVFVLLIVNKRAVLSAFGWGRAQIGKGGRFIETLDPVARMQQEADDARDQIKNYKQVLAKCEAIRMSLQSQVEEDTKNKARLTSRINRSIDEGKADTDPVLQNYAKQLAETDKRLTANKAQLEANTALYNNNLKNVQAAVAKIASADQEAKTLGNRLQLSESQRDLNEMFQKYDASGLNSSLGNFEKYKKIAEDKINANNASLKVTQDLGGSALQIEEDEGNEDARDLLASIRQQRAGAGAAPVAAAN